LSSDTQSSESDIFATHVTPNAAQADLQYLSAQISKGIANDEDLLDRDDGEESVPGLIAIQQRNGSWSNPKGLQSPCRSTIVKPRRCASQEIFATVLAIALLRLRHQ
jgi:hypothetical protein